MPSLLVTLVTLHEEIEVGYPMPMSRLVRKADGRFAPAQQELSIYHCLRGDSDFWVY